jgi:dTDP-4-dehydrorhamnose 3,5-epimerase
VALDDNTLFQYKCTNVYSKEHERGVLWSDPALGIDWGVENPIISEKDASYPLLANIPKEYYFQ